MQVKIIIFLNIVALYWLTFPFVSISSTEPTHEYQLTIEFSTIRIYYDELLSILGPTQSIIQNANHGYENDYINETLTISDGVSSFSWKGSLPDSDAISRLKVAYSANYYYYNQGAPIAIVDIQFRSTYREMRISGSSQEQIDALSAMLEKGFKKHTLFFGRDIIFFISYIVLVGVSFYFFQKVMSTPYAYFCSLAVSIIGAGITYKLFPGFIVLTKDSSFLQRNSPLFTFLGFVFALAAIGEIFIRLFQSHFKTTDDELDIPH